MDAKFLDLNTFFPLLDQFEHKSIFANIHYPWEVLKKIGEFTVSAIDARKDDARSCPLPQAKVISRKMGFSEIILHFEDLVEIDQPTIVENTNIFFDSGVVIEPGAMIKAPAYFGKGTEIRQGAYVRGNALIGKHCTIGHTTELKNSIFMNHTEAGHFAYVGDSICGSYVNLGAGTKLANLQLRKGADKIKKNFPNIFIRLNGEKINTETAKFGAILGDHCEAGCNCVTAPAVMMASSCWIMANKTVIKGFYSSGTIIK